MRDRRKKRKSVCVRGHRRTKKTLYLNKSGYGDCKKCVKIRSLARSKNPGIGKGGVNKNKTHCKNGHALSEQNVQISTNRQGYKLRSCKTCARNQKRELKNKVIAGYGGKCSWPGCDVIDPDMLTIDHVEDDGAKERLHTNNIGGFAIHRKIVREGFPPEYQILCANHNMKKEILRRAAN